MFPTSSSPKSYISNSFPLKIQQIYLYIAIHKGYKKRKFHLKQRIHIVHLSNNLIEFHGLPVWVPFREIRMSKWKKWEYQWVHFDPQKSKAHNKEEKWKFRQHFRGYNVPMWNACRAGRYCATANPWSGFNMTECTWSWEVGVAMFHSCSQEWVGLLRGAFTWFAPLACHIFQQKSPKCIKMLSDVIQYSCHKWLSPNRWAAKKR